MTKQTDLIEKIFKDYDIEINDGYINIYQKTKIACSRVDKQGVRLEPGFNTLNRYERKRILNELDKGRYEE